jgi:hypothetical protein
VLYGLVETGIEMRVGGNADGGPGGGWVDPARADETENVLILLAFFCHQEMAEAPAWERWSGDGICEGGRLMVA